MKICIDYSDGRFYVKSTEEDDLFKIHAEFATVIDIPERLWLDFQAFCEQDAQWQSFFRDADNRRMEKEGDL